MKRLGKIFKRPGRPGWYFRFTDPVTKQRITKGFPTKRLAEHYRDITYYRLNSDVYVGVINVRFSTAAIEYLDKYDLEGLSSNSKRDVEATLTRFGELHGDIDTKDINQRHFELYIRSRKDCVSARTLNKDIRNLKAFIAWAVKHKYISSGIELKQVKAPPTNHKALTTEQIRWLFSRCPTPAWRVRLLLSLTTGLRAGDIDFLARSSIDITGRRIDTVSQKTSKAYINRPLPDSAAPVLEHYLKTLNGDDTDRLFLDRNIRRTWDKIRGDSGITRQNMRLTFSTLIQKMGSIDTARDLLEHHSVAITDEFYTDKELILRWKVNQLPVELWLS